MVCSFERRSNFASNIWNIAASTREICGADTQDVEEKHETSISRERLSETRGAMTDLLWIGWRTGRELGSIGRFGSWKRISAISLAVWVHVSFLL
jgi:hypothetical protein